MSQLPATKTPATPGEVRDALRAAWRLQLHTEASQDAVCVLLAQWALETGEGASMVAYNIGNLKAPHGLAGPDFCAFSTFEYDAAGVRYEIHPPDPGCNFRAFATLEDGVENFLRGMWEHWTAAWPAVVVGNPEAFAAGLRSQGYYTAPLALYAAGVRAHFDRYRKILPWPPSPDETPTNPALMYILPDVSESTLPPPPGFPTF